MTDAASCTGSGPTSRPPSPPFELVGSRRAAFVRSQPHVSRSARARGGRAVFTFALGVAVEVGRLQPHRGATHGCYSGCTPSSDPVRTQKTDFNTAISSASPRRHPRPRARSCLLYRETCTTTAPRCRARPPGRLHDYERPRPRADSRGVALVRSPPLVSRCTRRGGGDGLFVRARAGAGRATARRRRVQTRRGRGALCANKRQGRPSTLAWSSRSRPTPP